MKVPKNKYNVNIVCTDGSFIKGYIHVREGLRIIDYLNDSRDEFVAVTETEFKTLYKKKDVVILNKKAIKWLEEIK